MPFYYFEVYDARPATDGGAMEPVKESQRSGAASFAKTITADDAIAAGEDFRALLDKDPYFCRLTLTAAQITDAMDGTGFAFNQRIGKGSYALRGGNGVNGVLALAGAVYQDLS